jgi:broad specificity phosphatase PhoE
VRIKYTPKINEISRGVYEHKPEEFKRALKESGEIEAVFRPPKGENYFDLEKRAQRFLEFLEKIHKNDSVLIVSHGLFLRLFLLRIFGLKMKEGSI